MANLLSADDLVVGMDYGQFSLRGEVVDEGEDFEAETEILEEALGNGQGVGQRDDLLVVLSPHQNNFEMALRVEVWDSEPDADLDDWQLAISAQLSIGETGIVFGSPTMEFETIDVAPGVYGVLLTARGLLGYGWPGSTSPGDQWRLRLWPHDGSRTAPRRLRTFDDPDSRQDSAHPREQLGADGQPFSGWVYSEAGQQDRHLAAAQAAERIAADITASDPHRTLSGRRGTATVHALVGSHIDALWTLFANPTIAGLRGPNESAIPPDHGWSAEDEFVGPAPGGVAWRWTTQTPPTHGAQRWEWFTGPYPGSPVLAQGTVLDLTLTDRTHDDAPATEVLLQHTGLPIEWVTDMTQIWTFTIDKWAYQSQPGKHGK